MSVPRNLSGLLTWGQLKLALFLAFGKIGGKPWTRHREPKICSLSRQVANPTSLRRTSRLPPATIAPIDDENTATMDDDGGSQYQ